MSLKHRAQKFGLTLVAIGALSLPTWTGAEARGLLLLGGLHHLGGFGGGFHHLGGFHPGGFGGGHFYGGGFGARQAGFGYGGYGRAVGYGGYGRSDHGYRGVEGGSRRRYGDRRYWGVYAAGAAAAAGAYYGSADSDNNNSPAYGYYDYPPYRN